MPGTQVNAILVINSCYKSMLDLLEGYIRRPLKRPKLLKKAAPVNIYSATFLCPDALYQGSMNFLLKG